MPAGSDAGGVWQWYREDTETGTYDPISGADTDEYTPSSTDIDKRIKAVYTIPDTSDFIGNKEASTTKIKKQLAVNPIITDFQQGADTADSRPTLSFSLESCIGYKKQQTKHRKYRHK